MKTMIILLLTILATIPQLLSAQTMEKIRFEYDASGNREARLSAKMLKESDTAFNNPVFPPYENTLLTENTFEINLHPVPTKNHLWVSFNGQVPQSFEYLLFDQLGKPVIEGLGEGANHMIDLTVLQAGVYYLQIKTVNMAIFRYKIVKH